MEIVEIFNAVDLWLNGVETEFGHLKTDVKELKTGFNSVQRDVEVLKTGLDIVKNNVEELKKINPLNL